MKQVITIDGACVDNTEVNVFNKAAALEWAGITQEELDAADGNQDVTAIDVKHADNDMVVITVFKHDGEELFMIGHARDFTWES